MGLLEAARVSGDEAEVVVTGVEVELLGAVEVMAPLQSAIMLRVADRRVPSTR